MSARVPASRCVRCEGTWVPPRAWCPTCGGDVAEADAAAEGTLASWTRVLAAPEGEAPGYVLALVHVPDAGPVLARADVDAHVGLMASGIRVTLAVAADGRVTFRPKA